MKTIRYIFFGSALLLVAGVLSACTKSDAETSLPTVVVYKSPTCGCCKQWVAHLAENGFTVKTTDMPDVTPMKVMYGVKQALRSCHTAVVDGYVLEGHVPAADLKRLLQERPDVTGLAVPGMPMGSPGMEGGRPDAYQVIAFNKNGAQHVFAQH